MTTILKDLARVKAMFQQRALLAAMGVQPELWNCPDCHNDLPPSEFDVTATYCDSCRLSQKEAGL